MSFLLWALLGIIIAIAWRRHHSSRNRYPYPPGPPANPVLGHALRLPTRQPGDKFHEWAQIYGDIMHFWMPGRHIIILNSEKVANDLLQSRSSKYSSRPHVPLFELMGWSDTTTFQPYGKKLVSQRKRLNQYLYKKTIENYYPDLMREACKLLQTLLSKPGECKQSFFLYASATIVKVTYGHKVLNQEDKYFQLALRARDSINNSGPAGNTALDFLPILQYFPRWFPGTYYADFARRMRPDVDNFHNQPFEDVLEQVRQGTAEKSFLSQNISELKEAGADDEEIANTIRGVAAVLFIGGADTSTAALTVLLRELVRHPEIFKKAQEEIDKVVGEDCLPTFKDRPNLPYVECVLQETLRFYPIGPLGVPRLVTADDVYSGMFIPKGTVVIPNLRGMSMDERVYLNPRKFHPDRFLPKPEGYNEPYFAGVFGHGRRICPGRYLAMDTVWIAAAMAIAVFNISKTIGADGEPVCYRTCDSQSEGKGRNMSDAYDGQ